jgi:hypothetical protein
MQMDWFIRGGAMVGRHPARDPPAHAPAPSQEQRALDELIARAVNRMKGRQRRPFFMGVWREEGHVGGRHRPFPLVR